MAIVDTSVLSYGINGATLGFTYARLLADYESHLSFMTVAELRYGAEKGRWSQRRRIELEILLQKYTVVPHSDGITAMYARVLADRERAGRPLARSDAWIAATALFHHAPLATHDTDFQGTPGLQLITASQADLRDLPALRFGARPTRPLDTNCSCSL